MPASICEYSYLPTSLLGTLVSGSKALGTPQNPTPRKSTSLLASEASTGDHIRQHEVPRLAGTCAPYPYSYSAQGSNLARLRSQGTNYELLLAGAKYLILVSRSARACLSHPSQPTDCWSTWWSTGANNIILFCPLPGDFCPSRTLIPDKCSSTPPNHHHIHYPSYFAHR